MVTLPRLSCLFATALVCGCASLAQAELIHYDASVLPNDPSLQGMFSFVRSRNATWSTDGSTLSMTSPDRVSDVWFGWSNSPRTGPTPAWSFAPNSVGNMLTMRAKVSPGAGYFAMGFGDGTQRSVLNIADGVVRITDAAGQIAYVSLDTTQYHNYSILSVGGATTYSIDGMHYAGISTPHTSPYLFVGDFNSNPLGTLFVQNVTIQTAVPEPGTFALFSLLAASAGLVLWRRRGR